MRWQSDVSRGDWVRERMADRFGHLAQILPTGFPAYVRVFHPLDARRPVGVTWREVAYGRRPTAWEHRPASWREVADEVGATWHPLVQWQRIPEAAPADNVRDGGVPARAGWRADAPEAGRLDAAHLSALAVVLARHTATPERGSAAVWEGWGDSFRRLDPAAATGPRLRLPGRAHLLFDAGIAEFEASDWPSRAPWVREGEPRPVSPSLIWPEDRAWVLATEVDFDSTVIGGSPALVADVVAATGVEAAPIPDDADLSSDGDRVNR
ncbi:hypothetical protein ABIQ69_02480 [Agromyces sp. G08B096]|uniref:Uncharacterized protein n=1 Tax=Agromyces sp. G08B096 TaxID=3156399 RepID=A0AAU7WA92_9MICO